MIGVDWDFVLVVDEVEIKDASLKYKKEGCRDSSFNMNMFRNITIEPTNKKRIILKMDK